MIALKGQVGGTHYKDMPYQPVELYARTQCTPFQANIWKYISRYPRKNGLEDIRKCIHYAQLAIELKCDYKGGIGMGFEEYKEVLLFCKENNLSQEQSAVVIFAATDNYKGVILQCKSIALAQYRAEL